MQQMSAGLAYVTNEQDVPVCMLLELAMACGSASPLRCMSSICPAQRCF